MKKIVACLTVVILSSFALGLKAQDKMKVLWLGTSIPFSDPTGHSDNVLNQVFVKLLSNIVHQETVKIDSSQNKGSFDESKCYSIDGIQGKKQSKGLVIVNGKDEKNTGQTKKCYGKILLIR